MIFKALLTLDLDGVSAKQRDTFYEYLKKEKWKRFWKRLLNLQIMIQNQFKLKYLMYRWSRRGKL